MCVAHSISNDDPLTDSVAQARAQQRWRGVLAASPVILDDDEDWVPPHPSDIWVEETAGPVAPEEPTDDGRGDGAVGWWRQAVVFGREHVAVVAVALIVGVIFGVMTFMRARPDEVPLTLDSGGYVTASVEASTQTPTVAPLIKVHVMGAVTRPGVVALPAGARVEDAIAAAGGLAADADPAQLNLAAVVADGSQIVIGIKGDPRGDVNVAAPGGSGGAAAGGAGACVNLNTASDAELQSLPGVGPVTAQKIMAWRTKNNRFNTVAELQEVDGIGPKTMAQLEPYVCVT